MIRIIDNRSTGKTSKLMHLAKENGGIFVCADPICMRYKAHAYGIPGLNIISYSEYHDHKYDNRKPIYIDEVERYLSCYGRIDGYSLSNED
jgi:hypothetical protein